MNEVNRCCCGKVEIETDCTAAVVNDYQHERPGGDHFCGPRWRHDVRDALDARDAAMAKAAALERQLAEAKEYVERAKGALEIEEMNSTSASAAIGALKRDLAAAIARAEKTEKELLNIHDACHRECHGPVDLADEIRTFRRDRDAALARCAELEKERDVYRETSDLVPGLQAQVETLLQSESRAAELSGVVSLARQVRDRSVLTPAWETACVAFDAAIYQLDHRAARAALAAAPGTEPSKRIDACACGKIDEASGSVWPKDHHPDGCWTWGVSSDEEHFQGHYASKEEALASAARELELKPGDRFWVGGGSLYQPHPVLNADHVLELYGEAAGDDCGEIAEDWPTTAKGTDSTELERRLHDVVMAWLFECRDLPTFYNCEKVTKHVVPAPGKEKDHE